MYTEMAGEDDKKMAERWQADADGILVFVSLGFGPSVVPTGSLIIDRSIFCRRCGIDCDIHPSPPAQPTRHNGVLSREYLSAAR